jgi:predicted molibdopterin-dependent oxidoreductase YjgC
VAELQGLLAGGKAVGVLVSGRCTNEEAYLGAKLARGALKTGHVDSPLRLHYEAILQGLAGPGEPVDLMESLGWIEGSRCIFILEGDLATTHPEVAFSVLRGVRRGASLVTLGLARTRMSDVASAHILLDPGSPRFVHPGPLELRRDLHSGSGPMSVILSPWTPDPRALSASVGALRDYLGRIAKESGQALLFLPLPIRANTRGAFEMGAAPGWLPGPVPLGESSATHRLRSTWGVDPFQEAGTDAEGMWGSVEGMVVIRDGLSALPLGFSPDSLASSRLESLVVLDAFRSPVSDAASVVLPLGGLSETNGTFTSGLGRVQRLRPAGRAPRECRQGWEVLAELLGRMGAAGSYSSSGDVLREIRAVAPAYGALDMKALEEGWGSGISAARGGAGSGLSREGGTAAGDRPPGRYPEGSREGEAEGGEAHGDAGDAMEEFGTHWLAVDGAFDWGDDPMVRASPTLRRDGTARRKLNPRGFVVMSPTDGASLGVRQGWTLRLRSRRGEALVPVSLDPRAEEGFLLVPAGFREPLVDVLAGAAMERVEVERA